LTKFYANILKLPARWKKKQNNENNEKAESIFYTDLHSKDNQAADGENKHQPVASG
jgi:hypothetical protein